MNRRLACSLLLSLVLLPCSAARADYMDWSYSWSNSPTTIHSVNGEAVGSGGLTLAQGGSGVTGTTDPITAVVVTSFSSATIDAPDTIPDPGEGNNNFSITLHLTDNADGDSADVTFNGTFQGTVWDTGADIKDPTFDATTKEVDLNGRTYVVTLSDVRAPGAPGSGEEGTGYVKATVRVVDDGGNGGGGNGGGTIDTPEPSTLILACSALGLFGVTRSRRQTRSRAGL